MELLLYVQSGEDRNLHFMVHDILLFRMETFCFPSLFFTSAREFGSFEKTFYFENILQQ